VEAIPDLIVFDWVIALGTTQAASALLDIPQSSVSRRYRALANQFAVPVRRHRGSLFISGEAHTYRLLRELGQHLRFEKHSYRWSWQPELRPLLQQAGHIGQGGRLLDLSPELWQQRNDYLQARILDACFELCLEDSTTHVGVVDLGLQLIIPAEHPLRTVAEESRLERARAFPLHSDGLRLPGDLSEALRADGWQLSDDAAPAEALVIAAGRGRADGLPLPQRLEAGWRIADPPTHLSLNTHVLERAVAPLDRRA
jgi:hypothetical protein